MSTTLVVPLIKVIGAVGCIVAALAMVGVTFVAAKIPITSW